MLRLQCATSEQDVGVCVQVRSCDRDGHWTEPLRPVEPPLPVQSLSHQLSSIRHSLGFPHACSEPAETRRDRCPPQPAPPPRARCHDSSLKIRAADAADAHSQMLVCKALQRESDPQKLLLVQHSRRCPNALARPLASEKGCCSTQETCSGLH